MMDLNFKIEYFLSILGSSFLKIVLWSFPFAWIKLVYICTYIYQIIDNLRRFGSSSSDSASNSRSWTSNCSATSDQQKAVQNQTAKQDTKSSTARYFWQTKSRNRNLRATWRILHTANERNIFSKSGINE